MKPHERQLEYNKMNEFGNPQPLLLLLLLLFSLPKKRKK
jgi:hypothetical protein